MISSPLLKRIILSLFLALAFSSQTAHAQLENLPKLPPDPATRPRYVSVALTMGSLEIMSAAVLVQLSEKYSLGLVASAVALYGGRGPFFNATWGAGVRWSYYFSRDGKGKFLWANVIAVDCQYLLPERDRHIMWRNPGGVGLEAVVGRDGYVGPGLGITWGAGVSMSLHHDVPPLFFPALRLGLHVDV